MRRESSAKSRGGRNGGETRLRHRRRNRRCARGAAPRRTRRRRACSERSGSPRPVHVHAAAAHRWDRWPRTLAGSSERCTRARTFEAVRLPSRSAPALR
eukprot:scaffold163136_cov32-Tisochrysis_lutea.AAC.7